MHLSSLCQWPSTAVLSYQNAVVNAKDCLLVSPKPFLPPPTLYFFRLCCMALTFTGSGTAVSKSLPSLVVVFPCTLQFVLLPPKSHTFAFCHPQLYPHIVATTCPCPCSLISLIYSLWPFWSPHPHVTLYLAHSKISP